jgi:predicted small metal-binding protein
MKRLFGGFMILALFLSFSAFAQEKMTQKEEKKSDKMEMSKSEKEMGPLMSVTCDPACGFMVRSHSEKELISMVKTHAKKMHNKTVTDKDVKGMMKSEESSGTKQ